MKSLSILLLLKELYPPLRIIGFTMKNIEITLSWECEGFMTFQELSANIERANSLILSRSKFIILTLHKVECHPSQKQKEKFDSWYRRAKGGFKLGFRVNFVVAVCLKLSGAAEFLPTISY